MTLNKFAYLYSKPLGNHTLKIMKKIPGNLLKKTGNIMEFCKSEKVGTLFIPHMAATFFINSQINIFKETHLPSFTSEKVFFVSPTTLSRNQRRQQHIPVS